MYSEEVCGGLTAVRGNDFVPVTGYADGDASSFVSLQSSGPVRRNSGHSGKAGFRQHRQK